MKQKYIGLLLILFSVFLVVVGQLLLKHGMNQIGELNFSQGFVLLFVPVFSNLYVLFGVLLFASSSFGWLLALSKVPLSFAYPIISVGYVVVSLLSWVLFQENLSIMRLFGLGLIVMGVLFLSRT